MPTAKTVSSRLATVLLLLASLGLCGTVVGLVGWRLAARRAPVSVDSLTLEQRQSLVRELLEASPGVFRSAYFEPRIGYTLQPGREHSVWNDTFVANELGYRARPASKPPGAVRVLFVGDSWTYGMGVSEASAFPRRVEELARGQAGSARRVEAWSLALPGYNTANAIAALDTFFDVLRPDAVVFGVTTNDVSSSLAILPGGALGSPRYPFDGFPDPWLLEYRGLMTNSHVYLDRWRHVTRAIADLERRLGERAIPLLLFFTGLWDESFAHQLIARSNIDAPYLVTPRELVAAEWLNPPPMYHANPRAHGVFAHLVYRGLQPLLGWPVLEETADTTEVAIHRRAELAPAAAAAGDAALARETETRIPPGFRPSSDPRARLQCLFGVDPATGLAGRQAALLLRREPDRQRLVVRLRGIDDAGFLYPLELEILIPSAGGGSRRRATIAPGASAEVELSLDLPPDVAAGVAFEVILTAPRATVPAESLLARSFRVVSVAQAGPS